MSDNQRIWHPSFGYFTRIEVDTLNTMRDGDEYKEKRKELDKEVGRCARRAEKKAKEIPFPPLKIALVFIALLAGVSPAHAQENSTLVCPAGTFRAVAVKAYDGQTASLEVYCETLPVQQPKEHPTLVQNAPPIDLKIINQEEE